MVATRTLTLPGRVDRIACVLGKSAPGRAKRITKKPKKFIDDNEVATRPKTLKEVINVSPRKSERYFEEDMAEIISCIEKQSKGKFEFISYVSDDKAVDSILEILHPTFDPSDAKTRAMNRVATRSSHRTEGKKL